MKKSNQQENQETLEKIEFDRKMKVIANAHEVSTLMAVLCRELGLTPYKTTHQEFVNKFSALQKEALEYKKEMQDQFITTDEVKVRKKRQTAEEKTAQNSETDLEYQEAEG